MQLKRCNLLVSCWLVAAAVALVAVGPALDAQPGAVAATGQHADRADGFHHRVLDSSG